VPYLEGALADAQAAADAAQQQVEAARQALSGARAAQAAAAAQLGDQRAQLAQLAAARDALAAQAGALAAQVAQANADTAAAGTRRQQAQQALDGHLAAEPEPPEGDNGKPPSAAAMAQWRRRHREWEEATPPLRQAVQDAEAALAAIRQRVAELAAQQGPLNTQLAAVQGQVDTAQAAVAATEARIAELQTQLPGLEQALDAAATALLAAQAEAGALASLAAAVERDPFDRAELEGVAADLGARLLALQHERGAAAAEQARLAAQGESLHADEVATRAQLAQIDASLPGLRAAADARAAEAADAEAAVPDATQALADATAAIRRHKQAKPRPRPRPPNNRLPEWEPYDEGVIEAWQEKLDGLAADQAQAIEGLVAARAARDAAVVARDAAGVARDAAQAGADQLTQQAAWLAAAASAAAQAAAAAQARVDALDPRIAELRVARETATARLLGNIATDRRIVLAPVRLETRFVHDAGGDALLVRIYPDDWFVDTHEPELTADEREWGTHYHEQLAGAGDEAARRRAWDQLAERYGPQRAAWLAHSLDPAAPMAVGGRSGNWTRAPRSALLPERWVAIAQGRDGEPAFTAWSRPVATDPLQVGPAPTDDPLGDAGARWLTDFDAAVEAGMALRVPLQARHAQGLDRLVVLGVRAELSDREATGRLAAALDGHHYTGGLAVLAPGTPSNTTASGGGYMRADPDGTRGFRTERGAPLVAADDGSDGALIAEALGVDAARLAHVAGADGRSRARAAAMHVALWPAVDGPLRQAMVVAAGGDAVHDHLPAVRAGGPLPVLRVGFQPYGIVPATSLRRWVAAEPGLQALADGLRGLHATWMGAAGRVPRATPGAPLGALLAQHAYSVRFTVLGADGAPLTVRPGAQPAGAEDGALAPDYVALLREADRATVEGETFAGWPDARTGPRPHPLLYLLLRAAVLEAADTAAADRVGAALGELAGGDAGQLRTALLETLDTVSHRLDAWVTSLATARLERLATSAVRFGAYGWLENLTPRTPSIPVQGGPGEAPLVERPDNQGHLLALSLAHAATAAVLRSGYIAHRDDPGSPLAIDLSSRRVAFAEWIVRGVQHGQPLAALLGYRFERLLGDAGLQRYLLPLRTLAGLRGEDELEQQRAAVATRERATARLTDAHAELAMASAAAQQALADATRARETVEALRDGYNREKADLEALVAAAVAADAALADVNSRLAAHQRARPKPQISENPGDVDNRGKPVKEIQEVDLAVLQAWQEQLAALRAEQQAATARAVAAHAAADPTGPRRVQLAQLITELEAAANPQGVMAARAAEDTVRAAAKQAADAAADKEVELRASETELATARGEFAALLNRQWMVARESTAAANVVDGLELHRRYRTGRAEARWDATTIPFGNAGLGLGGDAQARLTPALDDLADAVDAVGDLVVAESVHQLVLGNPLRSGATLDAVARGERPPADPEVIRTPRRGIGVTHRVVVLLDPASTATPAWGVGVASPRAMAEPRLNAWVSRLLPDPAQVACRVELRAPSDGGLLTARELHVDALGLSPLDLAYLAGRSGRGGLSELEQRLAQHAVASRPATVPADAQPRVRIDRDPSWPASLFGVADLLQAIGAVQRLLVQARGLDGRDLGGTADGIDVAELDARATAAARTLRRVRDALTGTDLDGLRAALLAAAGFGVEGALPASAAGDTPADREILITQAASVRTELSARLERAEVDGIGPRERLASLFGDAFVVLGQLAAPDLPELFGRGDNARLSGGRHLDLVGWLQRVGHVRTGCQRLSGALAAAETLEAGDRLRLRVGQLPVRASDRWVGLPPATGFSLEAGRVSIVAHVPLGAVFGTPASGLLVDEWVEVVPATTEVAGMTFHFDQSSARPPQTILVAVAPDLRAARQPPAWDLDTLEAVVQETWELARTRVIDPALLRAANAALTGVLVSDAVDLARAAEPDGGA
jgi:hypothetical protein